MLSLKIYKNTLLVAIVNTGSCRIKGANVRGDNAQIHKEENPESGFFLNLRSTTHPTRPGPFELKHFTLAGQCLVLLIEQAGVVFDGIAGIPLAGEPFANAIHGEFGPKATEIELIRLEKVSTNGERFIRFPEGFQTNATNVLIVNEVIDGAKLTMSAVDAFKNKNIHIAGVVTVVDRISGGCELLEKNGVKLISIFTANEVLQGILDAGRLDRELLGELLKQCEAKRQERLAAIS